VDRDTHQRYLDYRDRHAYFGKGKPLLPMNEFLPLDAEHLDLARREESLDDEERARFEELAALLHRD
jgi:hypothetical protein